MGGSRVERRKGEGQILTIFALMLPVLIVVAGLGVDGANLYLNFRRAQGAADLAALAGARLLPASPTFADYTAAEVRALSVAASNGYAASATAHAPYVDSDGQTHPNRVEVLISSEVSTFFLPLIGAPSFDVAVRAVAGSAWSATGGSSYAIFVACDSQGGTSCADPSKALEWSGSGGTVVGGTHSNCAFKVPGSGNTFLGGATYGTGCQYENNGSNNTYSPTAASANYQGWPITYNFADFEPCTFTKDGKLELKYYYESVTSTEKRLRDGIYCATGSGAEIVLDEQYVTGHVTLVSHDKITISGSNFNLTAYHSSKVVLWAGGTSSPTVTVGGSYGTFTGIIYARTGQVEISGSSNSTTGGGAIWADRVKIGGQNFAIDSAGIDSLGPASLEHLRLYE